MNSIDGQIVTEYMTFRTPLGCMGIAAVKTRLTRIVLPKPSTEEVVHELREYCSNIRENTALLPDTVQHLREYCRGELKRFPEIPDLSGYSRFRQAVWNATTRIPWGKIRNYGWIARQIGQPKASRAVGQALHNNPLPLLVPCHRVVSSDNRLCGFGGGIEIKKKLLQLEGVEIPE